MNNVDWSRVVTWALILFALAVFWWVAADLIGLVATADARSSWSAVLV